MPKYEIDIPNKGTFEVDSPNELTDAQVYAAVQPQLNQKPEKQSGLRQVADVPLNFTKGVVGGVRMLTDVFGADNAISKNLRGVEDYVGDLLSAQAKDNQKEISRIMKEAEDKGVLEQIKLGFQALSVAPVDLLSQAFGTVIPTLAGGLVGGSLRVGAKVAITAAEKAAEAAARASAMKAASIGTNALMATGTGKSAIYDAVTEELSKSNLPKEQIEQAAIKAQEYGGKNLDLILANTLLGGIAGGTGIEKALLPGMVKNITANVAKRGMTGRALVTGGTEAIPEFFQGGTEQASKNIALQREGFDVPTMRGVVSQATLEGATGAVLGGGIGAFSRPPIETPSAASLATSTATPPATPPAIDVIPAAYSTQEGIDRATGVIGEDGYTAANLLTPGAEGVREQAQRMATRDLNAVGTARPEMTEEGRFAAQQEAQQRDFAFQRQQQLAANQAANPNLNPNGFNQGRTPPPAPISVSPSQTQPYNVPAQVSAEERRNLVDAQSAELARAQNEPFEFDRRRLAASASAAGGTGQVRGQPRAELVDTQAMPPAVARNRLRALQDELVSYGQDPNSLAIVPHPTMGGRFAIERRTVEPLYVAPPAETITVPQAQRRIEASALAGSEQQRLAQDNPRQQMISRAMAAIEARGGVASPREAQLLREANMGQPYNRIDNGLEPQGSVDERLTQATGIELQRTPRESVRGEDVARTAEYNAEQDRRRQSERVQKESETNNLVQATNEAPIPPQPKAVMNAFATPAPLRTADQVATINQARARLNASDVSVLEMAGQDPASMKNAVERIQKEHDAKYSLNDIVATPNALASEVESKLLPILKRFGLGKMGLRLVDTINGGKADGMYFRNVITLALNGDPMGVMRHEVIHALKELGAFTAGEWKVLTDMAKKKYINQFYNAEMQAAYKKQYIEDNGSEQGFDAYMAEEAIAQAFRYFSETKPPAGLIGNLIRRLNKVFTAIREFFVGNGVTNAEQLFLANQIFSGIESGRMTAGRAGVTENNAPKFSKSMQTTGDLTPMSVQNVRIYNKEIENLVKTVGSRIAGMSSDQTLDDVRKAIKKLQSFTAQGLKGREWYERSSKAILEAFNGDPVLAEKLFQIIAITSANTEVSANFTKATNAWQQFTKGVPIRVGTKDTNKKIEALLYFGIDWEGRKTNTFYINLMEAMEGKDTGRSTIDLHMTRMLFGKDQPTDAQYELAENMVRLLASKLDIPPRQIQAASWVTQKAKGMFEDYRKRGQKKDLDDDALRQYAFQRAVMDYSHLMKAKVQMLTTTPELKEPSPSIRARTQTITGEVIPSVQTNMSQMETLPFPIKNKLTKDVMRSGVINTMADALGLTSRVRVTASSGGYNGKVNPNLKVLLINQNQNVAEKEAVLLSDAMSYVFVQDATPFFRADPILLNKEQFGLSYKFTKPLTPTVQNKMLGVLSKYLGSDVGFSAINPNEIVVINFRDKATNTPFLMSDNDFIDAAADAQVELNNLIPVQDSQAFGAKSEYNFHDWQTDTSGKAIITRLQNSLPNRPNLQNTLDSLRQSFVKQSRNVVTAAGQQPRFSLTPESDKLALRPSDSGGAGISFNDRQEGAVSYAGSHYGKVKTNILSGGYYGTGLKGAEAKRLAEAKDFRIRKRLNFYIPRANGTMPHRESGVGNHVYTQKFDNILGPGPTMSALYKKAAGDANAFESFIIDNGYDGYAVPDYGMMVVLNNDIEAKYEGTVGEVHNKPKFSLRAPTTPEFKRFFGDSKVVNNDGTPKVMYHGSANNIYEFIGVKAGAIFVTGNPSIAENYTQYSEDFQTEQAVDELKKRYVAMPLKDRQSLIKKALQQGVKQKAIKQIDAKNMLQTFADTGFTAQAFDQVQEFLKDGLKDSLSTKANIMPLYVRAENTFDFNNPEHIKSVSSEVRKNNSGVDDLLESLKSGYWMSVESDAVQKAIKSLGFDSFFIKELGQINLAVYDPTQVKSATGNTGAFSRGSKDIRYSLSNNTPPATLTKLLPNLGASQQVIATIKDASNAVRQNDFITKARIAFVDDTSALGQSLGNKDLSPFANNQLRADMLRHAQSQNINLITNGLQSGVPILNSDGSIIIQRTEDNVARSIILADKLDNNPYVVASKIKGGRNFVAEVARALRGADIKAEDAVMIAEGQKLLTNADDSDLRLNAEIKAGGQDAGTIASAKTKIDQMRKQGKELVATKRELQVDDAQIQWAEAQLKNVPELQEIFDIWKSINNALTDLSEDTGVISKEQADKYRNKKFYVPLFKAREDLAESFFQGSTAKSVPKNYKLEGSEAIRNIWENVQKQYAMTIAVAYENQTRKVAVEQLQAAGLAKTVTNPKDPNINIQYKDDGKIIYAIAENQNDVAAFQMMNYELSPIMKAISAITKVLRFGALVNPMFWIKQLIRDSIHTTLSNGQIVTPFHSAVAFAQILSKSSASAKLLADRGVTGAVDSTVSLNEYIGQLGKENKAPNKISSLMHKLMQVHEASDAATRVAVFESAKKEALKKGLSEEDATNFAVYRSRESINFSVKGNSKLLNNLRHSIPFFQAAITSLDTVYRAASGYGLPPAERKKAQATFIKRAGVMVILSTVYAMMLADDEEYKDLPDYVKDGNWLFPITINGRKTFVKIPVPFEIGFLFKTLPEAAVRWYNGTSTGKEVIKSYADGLIHNLPGGGNPIPQAFKPILESITNYSFFTGNPIEGMSDKGLPVEKRGRNASEFSRAASEAGLSNVGLSPAKIDALIKGYFAELGGTFLVLSSSLMGKESPTKNLESQLGAKAFLTDSNVSKAVSDFYTLEHNARDVVRALNKMKNEGLFNEAREYIDKDENKRQIAAAPVFRKIGEQLSTIKKSIAQIENAESLSPDEKQERINRLKQLMAQTAKRGYEVAERAGIAR